MLKICTSISTLRQTIVIFKHDKLNFLSLKSSISDVSTEWLLKCVAVYLFIFQLHCDKHHTILFPSSFLYHKEKLAIALHDIVLFINQLFLWVFRVAQYKYNIVRHSFLSRNICINISYIIIAELFVCIKNWHLTEIHGQFMYIINDCTGI